MDLINIASPHHFSFELEELGTIMTTKIQTLPLLTTKREKRTAFNGLVRTLKLLHVIPSSFVVHYITTGIDKNGIAVVIIGGAH